MPKFESRRTPEITRGDLQEINTILKAFDKISFNYDAELIATLETNFPILGKVTISYYLREHHISVFNSSDESIFRDHLYNIDHDWEPGNTIDRENMIALIKRRIKDLVATDMI